MRSTPGGLFQAIKFGDDNPRNDDEKIVGMRPSYEDLDPGEVCEEEVGVQHTAQHVTADSSRCTILFKR